MRHNCSVYLKDSLPIFDIVFTTKPRNLEELPNLGARKVVCIFQAYDCKFHKPIALSVEEQKMWGRMLVS